MADVTVSFFGILNIFGLIEKGIAEAARVTASSGTLFNTFLDIKEDSEGFKRVIEVCKEYDMAGTENMFLFDHIKGVHEKYFPKLETITVVESIYENDDNVQDLLPYRGEWFAYRIFAGRK